MCIEVNSRISIFFSAKCFCSQWNHRDLGRRLVEAEMDLTLAKSQGFLRKKDSSSSGKKLLAVIGVYTGFGGRSSRNSFRSSWIPNGWLEIMLIAFDVRIFLNIRFPIAM